MSTKYNLQELSDALANRSGASRKAADTFVHHFFDIITAELEQNQIVKIKGFGTFKLVDVMDRESVDVNTGKRIVISGHTKVNFTPDNALRDAVNKPFIDFETVILNDEADLEEMERVSVPMPEEENDVDASEVPQPEQTGDAVPESVIEESEESIIPHADEDTSEPDYTNPIVPTEISAEETSTQDEHEELDEDVVETNESEKPTQTEPLVGAPVVVIDQPTMISKERVSRPAFKLLKYASVFLLMVCSYIAGYHRILPHIQFVPAPKVEEIKPQPKIVKDEKEPVSVPKSDLDSIAPDTLSTPVSPPTPVLTLEQVAEQYPQIPGGKYLIVGTKSTHKMGVGDNLYKLARTTYGSHTMVQYIVVYNQFQNPDIIPPGYIIKLPELKEKE